MLVLSPRCWPISPVCHMDEPGRFFSAALSSPLHEFANFCKRSECHGSGGVCESHWGPGPPQQLSQKWDEYVAGVALSPYTDAVPGRPEPAGPGVHEAPAVAVDVAGSCRTAVWRLPPPRVHTADVHPAVFQQHRGRSWGCGGVRETAAAGVRQGCCLPSAGVCSSEVLLALLVWMGLWLEGLG